MRKAWGIVVVMAFSGACAEQSGATQQPAPVQSESQGSAVDPNALTPERQDAIERTFQRKAGSLQDCWAKEYDKTKDRKFEDDITVGFEIEPSGNPTNVRILKATGNNHDVES